MMIRHALARCSVVVLFAAFALAPAARADTLIQPLSGARNLTEAATGTTVAPGGQIVASPGWLAWAQPAAGGRWRLAVRSPQGVTTTPAIADFGAAPDPSIGSDRFGITGRRLFVVYSRCTGTSTIAGCDVYRYDVTAGTEAKVTAISTATASETAPSVRSGLWSFVRRGSGASHPGVYVHTPNGGTRGSRRSWPEKPR